MDRTLMFTPTGVCYNCLNNAHRICQKEHCSCKARGHKQWWFRSDGQTDETAAMAADGLTPISDHI